MTAEESSSLMTFQTDSPEYFAEHIAPVASNIRIQPCGQIPYRATTKLLRLPRLGLFNVKMSSARVLDTEPLGYLSITVPLDNPFQMMLHGQAETLTIGSAYVAHWDDTFDLRIGDHLDTLVVNIETSLLCDYVRKFQGGEEPQTFQFAPKLSLLTPGGSSFWRYLSFVWGELTGGGGLLRSPLVITELEETLVALLLYAVMDELRCRQEPRQRYARLSGVPQESGGLPCQPISTSRCHWPIWQKWQVSERGLSVRRSTGAMTWAPSGF